MPGPNLLIGNGESLTQHVTIARSGSPKKYPYTIEQARARLARQIEVLAESIDALPREAKPSDEGVGLVAVHPAFLAKTYLPSAVFRRAGLRSVGSRPVYLKPERDERKNAPEGEQFAAELYVTGNAAAFREFRQLLLSPSLSRPLQLEFCRIERIRVLDESERLLHLDGNDARVAVELVLHGDGGDESLLSAFASFARSCGADVGLEKRYGVPGLVFLPATVGRQELRRFAQFSALRAIRRLPTLRTYRPVMRQRLTTPAPALPDADAVNGAVSVTVFDGGIGAKDFARWCSEHIPAGLKTSRAEYLSHGTEVTSTLLFGHVDPSATTLPQPYFKVVHHRVVGAGDETDVDLYDCMRRIEQILRDERPELINLSIGPNLCVDDGQPHAWTCMLDAYLSTGEAFATIAVGNDGDLPDPLNRIQVPADAVNALAVGSADSTDFMWDRAPYSCCGPGRSPGLVKPDGLAFGGTATNPVVVLNPFNGGLTGVHGTSFGAPLALRVAAGAKSVSDTPLAPTTLRALLIHRAERAQMHEVAQVGWGRFPGTVEDLLSCPDNEATVIYQGDLQPGQPLRAKLPIPAVPLGTRIAIRATLCFATDVDPADPINYTRHGLTVVFRPRGEGSSETFFSSGNYDSEQDLRQDAYKWETVLHRAVSFKAEELVDSCFDIEHGARERGLKVANSKIAPLPYVLIVTVSADTAQPVYNSVLQRYRSLQPIRLRERIRLRT